MTEGKMDPSEAIVAHTIIPDVFIQRKWVLLPSRKYAWRSFSLSFCVWVAASTVSILSSDQMKEDMVDGALHLRQHLFAPVMSFMLKIWWNELSRLLFLCSNPYIILKYLVHRLSWNLELTSCFLHVPARISVHSLHNRLPNRFGTNQTLSTKNRLAWGCSSLCLLFHYIEYSLTTHIQLFCYVVVAYSSSCQGKNFIMVFLDAILLEIHSKQNCA